MTRPRAHSQAKSHSEVQAEERVKTIRKRRSRRSLLLEQLEDRTLLSVTAFVQNQSLQVVGDAASDSVSMLVVPLGTPQNPEVLDVLNEGTIVGSFPIVSPGEQGYFSSIQVTGGTGPFALTLGSQGVVPLNFTGGSSSNTLIEEGALTPIQWTITGLNTGNYLDVSFSGIQNLTDDDINSSNNASHGGDTFVFQPGGSVSGVITGSTAAITLKTPDGVSGTIALAGNVLTSGNLTIEAGRVTIGPGVMIASNLIGGVDAVTGDLTIQANTISAASDVTFSSRRTGGANTVTGDSTGDSGSISFAAPSITLNQGDLVLAQVEPGSQFQPGNITLDAEVSSLNQVAQIVPISSTTNQAQIQLTGATVKGADITITAGAINTNLYDDLGTFEADASQYINATLTQVPNLAISADTGISAEVVIKESDATIGLDGAMIEGSGAVTVGSTATSDASFHTVAVSGTATGGVFAISVGYGQATSSAVTTVTDSTITGVGAVAVTSSATTTDDEWSRIGSSPVPGAVSPAVAIALAIANTNETSTVTISQGSTVQSTGSKVQIDAAGNTTSFPIAASPAAPTAVTAAAVAVDYDKASIKTEVDGNVDGVLGVPTGTFNADPSAGPVAVNYQNSTITIPNNGLVDGTSVAYSNGGATSIGGLTNGSTYYVDVLSANTFQLANGPTIPLSFAPVDPTATSTQTLGKVSAATASGVDTGQGTITITPSSAPGNFNGTPQTGDIVTYLGATSGAPGDAGGGLIEGKQYTVQPVSGDTIKLVDPVTGTVVPLTSGGNGAQSFFYESNADTKRFSPSQAVDSTTNTITFTTPDDFQTGDLVVYHTDPANLDPTVLNGQTVDEKDQPISGLDDGQSYYVVVVNPTTIRLSSSLGAAQNAVPIKLSQGIDLTGVGLGSQHTLEAPGATDAVDINAGLTATNLASSNSVIGAPAPDPATAIINNLVTVNPEVVITSLTSLVTNLAKSSQNTGGSSAQTGLGSSLSSSFGIAGAVTLTFVDHDVETTIGSTARITSSADLKLGSDITELKATAATAAATKTDPAAASVAVAVGVGLYDNTARATVDGGAQLNAGGTVGVESTVSYPILLANLLTSINPLDYLSGGNTIGLQYANDGSLGYADNLFNTFVVATGDTALVGAGGAFAYNQFNNDSEATLEPGALVNQDDDSGQPSPRFRTGNQAVSVTADTDMTLINVVGIGALSLNIAGGIATYKDLTKSVGTPSEKMLGGIQDLFNPFGASGSEGGIGASLDIDNVTDTTIADVGTGAKVYTGAGTSLSFNPATAVSGNTIRSTLPIDLSTGAPVVYQTNGTPIGGLENGATYYVIANPTDGDQIQLALTPEGAADGTAIALDPSQATGSQSLVAPSLIVNATTPVFDLAFAEAGAGGSGFGIAGAITLGLVNNTTLARVDSGAQIQSRSGIDISAIDDLTRIGVDGGVAKSQSVGVGISLGVNMISRDTEAYIGEGYDKNGNLLPPGVSGTLITAAGPIAIDATTTGDLWSAAIAGAVATPSNSMTPSDTLLAQNAPTKAQQLLGISSGGSDPAQTQLGAGSNLGSGAGKAQASLSAAGAATINIVNQENTRAFINDTGDITTGQELAIEANADSSTWALAGSVAVNTSTAASSTGLAGAIGVNIMNHDNEAFINWTLVQADSVVVSAEQSGGIRSLAAGASGVTNDDGTSVAGSVSVNVVLGSVIAYVDSASLYLSSDSSVTAEDSSDIWAIGGAAAYGGQTGVGISIAVNLLGADGSPDQTNAYVLASDVIISNGTLAVEAVDADPAHDVFGTSADPRIIAFTGSAGISTNENGIAGAGMVSVNIIDTAVNANITDSSVTEPVAGAGTVSVAIGAVDSSGTVAIGGSVALGMGSGAAAAIGYNEIDDTVSAEIWSGTVDVTGGVSVTALSEASILGIAVGVAGGGGEGFAAAGSASVNIIQDVVQALIFQAAHVTAGGSILVEASDTSSIVAAAGGIGAAVSGPAVGLAVTFNLIQNTVSAYTENAKIKSGGDITFDADSSPAIIGVAAGIAGSAGDIAGAGSIAVNSIVGAVDAHVADFADVEATGDITIVAAQSAPMVSVSGALGISTGLALGGAFSYNYIGAGGNTLSPSVVNNPATLTGPADSEVTAYITNAVVISTGGSIAVDGGLVAPGTSLASQVPTDTPLADRPIVQGHQINALSGDQNLTIPLPEDLDTQIISVSAAGAAGGGAFSAAGSVSLNFIKNSVDVGIYDILQGVDENGTLVTQEVNARNNLTLDAADASKIIAIAGGLTVSLGAVGVGGAVSDNDIQDTVTARIGSALAPTPSDPTALAPGGGNGSLISGDAIGVSASNTSSILNVTFDLSVAGDAALGAAVSVNKIADITAAYIANSSLVDATTAISITAENTSNINATAGSGEGSGSVAAGAAAGYNAITDTVLAFVDASYLTIYDPVVGAGQVGGGLAIAATSAATIQSLSLGIAVGGDAALAGSGVGNAITDLVEALITDNAHVTATGNVTVSADSNNSTSAFGGDLGAGFYGGVGGAVAVNLLTNTTLASVDGGSQVTAQGQGAGSPVETWGAVAAGAPDAKTAGLLAVESDNGVALTASTTETLNNVTAAVGGAVGLGIGLDVLVNIVNDTTHATIDAAGVLASGASADVIVRAHQETDDSNSGGSGAVGLAAAAVGINVDVIHNDTEALIVDTQNVDAGLGVEVSALNRTTATTTAVGVAIGAVGLAGSATGLSSSSTTQAAIDGATVTANDGPIDVAANNAVNLTFQDGSGAGGIVGGGGAVAVGIVSDTTTAALAGALTTSGGDTDVEADSAETLSTQAFTGAVGAAGIGGTVAVMSIAPTTTASIDSGSIVAASGALHVDANDTLDLPDDFVGTVAAGILAGVGFAVEVITVHDTVDAHIADATASGNQGVTVAATGDRAFAATLVAVGAAGGIGIDGAVSVVSLGADLDSTSSGQVAPSQDSVNNSLLHSQGVSGLNTTDNSSLAQPGAIGAQLESGANANLFAVSLASGTSTVGATQAYIGAGAKVSSSAGGLTVSATETVNIQDRIGGGALGLIAAAGASVGITTINSDTMAYISSSATVSVAGNVTVSSTYFDNVSVSSYGAQGAIGIALGAVYSSINDTSTQTSYIAGDVAQAQQVTIEAQGPNSQSNHDLTAYDFGLSVGLAAAGATIGTAANTGSTSAYLAPAAQFGSSVGGLTVTASSGTLATTNMLVTAGGGIDVRDNNATTTITPTIDAYIGQNDVVNVTGDVKVTATSALAEGHANAQSYGGGGIDIAAGVAQVTTSPVVKGYIDQGSQVTAGGDISVTSAGDQVPPPSTVPGTFNPSQTVDTQTSTIAFPTDLGDGTEVQYQAGNISTPIGGLESSQITLNVNVSSQGSGNFKIVRTDGNSWAADGFTPGAAFDLTYTNNSTDAGLFTITSVSGDNLFVTGSSLNTGNQSAIFALNRVYLIMNPSYTATGLTFANSPAGNTITRTAGSWVTDGFVAGETIAVTGSNDAGTYTVQAVTDSTLTLAVSLVNNQNASWSLAGTLINSVTITSQGHFRLGTTFDASQVNAANDTITFAGPDDFQTGDAIQIDPEGNPIVGGLQPGTTYYVRTLDTTTIQLTATLAAALAQSDDVTPSNDNISTGDLYLPNLAQQFPGESSLLVTYNAPTSTTFYPRDVNITIDDNGNQSTDANTIYVTPNNLKDADTVTYSFSGTVSPIQGLTQGEQLVVHFASTDSNSGTANIQVSSVSDPSTPITLTMDPTAQGTMTLVASGFGPLVPSNAASLANGSPLVDGDSYTVEAVPGMTGYYQLMEAASGGGLTPVLFVTTPDVWNPQAVQMFTGGVLAVSPSTGTQSIYIDLSTAPDQTDQLTISPGSVGLSSLAVPTATGVSTATAEGGGGGIGSFEFPTASLTAQPVVWAYSAAASLVAGGNVSIEASSTSDVTATITNGSGGALDVGQVQANVVQEADTEAFVASPFGAASTQATTINATNFTLTSSSDLTSYVSARSTAGGFIGAAIAHTSDQVKEETDAVVGAGANINATGAVTIAANAQKSAHTNAYTLAIAVGGGANSDQQSFSTPSGVNVEQGSQALVAVEPGAIVTGLTVSLDATDSASALESDASATAISPIFFGVDVALATVNVVDDAVANVVVDHAAITGTQGVDILSIFAPAVVTTHVKATAVAIIPVSTAKTNVKDNTKALVSSSQGSLVTAGVRSDSGPLEQVSQDTTGKFSVADLALNVQAYQLNEAGAKDYGDIAWSADVYILGGGAQLARILTIDANNNPTGTGGFLFTPSATVDFVVVLPAPAPSAYFFGEQTAENGNSVPTFTFGPTIISSITIHDSSNLNLEVRGIDVTGLALKPEVYLDAPNQAIVNNSSPFDFHIVTAGAQPTLIDIEDDNPNHPFVQLDGIYNPIGQTIIHNLSGDIDTGGGAITTNSLEIVAGGNVGGAVGGGSDLVPLPVQMVQYQNDSNQTQIPVLGISAGGSVTLDLQGLLAYSPTAPDFMSIDSNPAIEAGNGPDDNIVIYTEQGIEEGPATATGGGVIVVATQQSKIGTYYSYYYPDGTAVGPDALDQALYGNLGDPGGDVRTEYEFPGGANPPASNPGGLIAGGNVMITPASGSPTIDVDAALNLNPVATATGKVTVLANGYIGLWEYEGAMRVGTINSQATPANDPLYGGFTVNLASDSPDLAQTGLDIIMDPTASVAALAPIRLYVENNFDMAVGATISSPTSVNLETDYIANDAAIASGAGSTVQIAGAITTPSETIQQNVNYKGATPIPLSDSISLTNVQSGTTALIETYVGKNTINLASLDPYNGGQMAAIAGPTTVHGSGADTLNLDDSGDTTAWTGNEEPTLTATNLTGLGMGTPTGVAYSGLAALNLELGTVPQTVNVKSTALGTTSTIMTQATGNTWNVGSLAPTITGGILAGIQGRLIIDGGGSSAALTDTLNVDDSGSTLANETGILTDSTLNGMGMTPGTINFEGMAALNMTLGNNGTALDASIVNNLPMTTVIKGGPSRTDTFNGQWDQNFNGSLTLDSFGNSGSPAPHGVYLYVTNEFYGSLASDSVALPGEIWFLAVGRSINAGASITAGAIDNLVVDENLDINLNLPGLPALPNVLALGSGQIGGTLPAGITLSALDIGVLDVGDNGQLATANRNLAGDVTTIGNLGTLDEVGGSIATTSTVTVGGNLQTLIVGPGQLSVGQNMAGVIDVSGTLGSATIAGGTPGLFEAGHVGTIGAYGGFGPIDLRVIGAGVQRWLEEDPAGQVFSQPNAAATATTPGDPNYINTQYFYEWAGSTSPQISARITNGVSGSPDQFDLSTVVFQNGASFNLDRLDASGSSGIRNVAVEGSLVTTLSPAASAFFILPSNSPDPSPAGVYLPMDDLASVSVRDYAPNHSIVAAEIQAVAFGSFKNTSGAIVPGSQATNTSASSLLGVGTTIVPSGSVNGQNAETFRVPFAAVAGQQSAFFLDTANSGHTFDPNYMVFTLESDSNGVNSPTLFPATRGAVTAMIGVDATPQGSVVQTVSLYGDGGSILSEQFIAQSVTSTGPLGDLTVLSPQGLNNVTAPSIFGNIAAAGPLFGTIQTTGVRTDPVTGATSEIPADLGRAYVVTPGGRSARPYVTATTIGGQGTDSLTGRIISRGNLISSIRSDAGATGLIAAQGNFGAMTSLLGTPTRVGGLLVNGGFSGQLVVLGNDYGDLTFNGGLTGGRIAVEGTGGAQSGILGNVIIDRGLYPTGSIGAGSAIVSGGEIGDASLGTALSVTDGNQGIVAAIGVIRLGTGPLGGSKFNNVGAGNPNAAAIDAIFTDDGQPLELDLPNQPLAGLALILEDLAALHVDSEGHLAGPKP
jgi:hypothetical protein